MDITRFKRWILGALVGVFAIVGVGITAVPTAHADDDHHGYYGHDRDVRVVQPGYGYGYHRPGIRIFGGGPRVYVAPRAHYRHHDYYRYGGYHHGRYYRY